MPMEPDNKDWTWVLSRPCPECHFESTRYERSEISAMIRANSAQWRKVLAQQNAHIRSRDDLWSVLEYGCHVRDVYTVYQTRVVRMLTEDGPHYANWDQNVTARDDGYAQQNPTQVAAELDAAADAIATTFEGLHNENQWQRTGFRGDGSDFTVESISRYMIHDTIHHLVDIGLSPIEAGATARIANS